MLREQASKLLQQAKKRNSDFTKPKQQTVASESTVSASESQEQETQQNGQERKNSLPTEFKTTPFTLVKKKTLKELSPRHFLKEKKSSVGSGL